MCVARAEKPEPPAGGWNSRLLESGPGASTKLPLIMWRSPNWPKDLGCEPSLCEFESHTSPHFIGI